MFWALAKVIVRLPENHEENDEWFLKRDGKGPIIAEVFGNDEGKPFGFAHIDFLSPHDWLVLLRYWPDIVRHPDPLEYPKDFDGKAPWIEFGMDEESAKALWDNEEDKEWDEL